MKYHFMQGITFLLAIALFTGCDDNDDPLSPPTDDGSFLLEISGDVEASFSGEAWFGSSEDPETGQTGFVLWLFTDDENIQTGDNLWFVHLGATQPAETEYPIGDFEELEEEEPNPEVFYGIFAGYSVANAFLGGESGTIDIATATSSEVTGTFSFTASGISLETGDEITAQMEGEFNAVPGPVVIPEN